ncbi:ArsR/SmtB family transcription factor [Rhodovibrionaceae bacterium A322]
MPSSENLDATFAALADPTRREIISTLAGGTQTVGDLASPFDMSLPAISKHLKILEKAGLIQRERRGREIHCQLEADTMQAAADWIAQTRAFWESRLDALGRHLDQMMLQDDAAAAAGTGTSDTTSLSPAADRVPAKAKPTAKKD